MAMTSAVLLAALLAAATICGGSSSRLVGPPATTATKQNATATTPPLLHHFFYVDSCPQLETIVRSTVDAAVRADARLTAGLLRVFFHDCFPNGCDASILLDGGERQLPPNAGLQQAALQLVEDARAKVHAACGPAVSCADILVLATRDAVNIAGGPSFTVPLGRQDSKAPASDNDVFTLPPPTATVDELLAAFNQRGLSDPADLVALSGAHTVGKARCSSFSTPPSNPPADDITRCLTGICAGSGTGDVQRDLDFLTPEVFDNMYYIDLTLNKARGVMLDSDQGLASHPSTNWLVKGFADNHWWFFDQFGASMVKMSQLKGSAAGEIRGNCFRPNGRSSVGDEESVLVASA